MGVNNNMNMFTVWCSVHLVERRKVGYVHISRCNFGRCGMDEVIYHSVAIEQVLLLQLEAMLHV